MLKGSDGPRSPSRRPGIRAARAGQSRPAEREAVGGRKGKMKQLGRDRMSDDILNLQVGTRVRHARILKGMLVRELAQAVGCTESTISKIENDRVLPSLPMMQKLINASIAICRPSSA
jgi:DNA-binding XRE family transcriptional regulator